MARQYLDKVAEDFDAYAEANYLPAVTADDPDELRLLAGLRFIETRKITDYGSRLWELFTMKRAGANGRDIDRACLDALVATADDPVALCASLALVATVPRPLPTTKMAERAVRESGVNGHQALLRELEVPHDADRLRRLVRLLVHCSGIMPRDPALIWQTEDRAERLGLLNRWRDRLSRAGLLPPATTAASATSVAIDSDE